MKRHRRSINTHQPPCSRNSERRERRNGNETIFKKMVAENFPE
jgi:hypothetical protein